MSSNTTSTGPSVPTPTTPTAPTTSTTPSTSADPTTTAPASSSSSQSSTSLPITSSSSSTTSTTSSSSSTTSSTTTSSTTTSTTSSTSSTPSSTSSTSTVIVHSTSTSTTPPSTTTSSITSSTSTSTTGVLQTSKPVSHGLSQQGTIAVAVVVPIVAVALILTGLIFLWRRRKARKDAEELRRKEVEEYGYNPNNDPTLPSVGDGAFEMREDGASGYRGWGTTAVASSGRKASTTQSGPSAANIGMAYSDSSPSRGGAVSDTRSDQPLMGEPEGMGAMGPAAAGNRGDIHRGPSNASSSYSAANRSDGSGEVMQSGPAYYSNQYDTGNPYGDAQYGNVPGGRAEMGGQPVIRDVEARRNTRIENPAHFPQQSAGISQNF